MIYLSCIIFAFYMLFESGETMNIGEKIISLREQRGWTQKELANRVNINVSVMNRIESNDRPLKDSELLTFANIFEVSADYLLGRSDKKDNYSKEKNFKIDETFEKFSNNPNLEVFYKELPESDEEKVQQLKDFWEFINKKK